MDNLLLRVHEMENAMRFYGKEMVIALAMLVGGLILIKWINQGLKNLMSKMPIDPAKGATVRNVLVVILIAALLSTAAIQLGIAAKPVVRLLVALTLVAVGLIVVFRPLIPTLPFKVGNTVKAGELLGKVEATTVLNTRLRTFDGTTVFVPNRKILDDIVINYHFTPTRRFDLKINIQYDQDLMKARHILEAIMIEDPRVKKTPRPVVHLMSLNKGFIELQGRGWTDNLKRFAVNRELLLKTKLCFDQEGIKMALPQMQVHYTGTGTPQQLTKE